MNLPDIIVARAYGDRNQATLNDIISDSANYHVKIIIDGGVWMINENLTFPENVSVEILPDAILNIASGRTLTIESDSFIVHRYDWHSGAGSLAGAPDNGRFIGIADKAEFSKRLLAEGLGQGLELAGELVQIKTATDTDIGGGRMATTSELKAMLSEALLVNPALLSKYLDINLEFNSTIEIPKAILANVAEAEFYYDDDGDPLTDDVLLRIGTTITPRFTDSRILIFGIITIHKPTVGAKVFLNRKIGDASPVKIGNGKERDGAAQPCLFSTLFNSTYVFSESFCYVDAPNTISPCEYWLSFNTQNAGALQLNAVALTTAPHCSARTTFIALELPRKTVE